MFVPFALLQVGHQQLARRRFVAAADADGSEKRLDVGMGGHVTANRFPQQQQRSKRALIFSSNEGSAQFQRWSKMHQKRGIVFEQGGRIERLLTARGRAESVGAG